VTLAPAGAGEEAGAEGGGLGGDPTAAPSRAPIKAIAPLLGVSKNTVKMAIASDGPPRYERAPRGSIVDEVEPRLHELLKQWPDMPATVIAERIAWTRSDPVS
jgi:hypothetical protein